MKLSVIKCLFGIAILAICSGPALANMNVYPMELGIGENGAAQIRVMSQSDGVQFVKVTEKQIINAGTEQEKEVSVEQLGKSSLVITPNKLAISAGSQRLVRLVALELPEKETTWRVYFEGVSGLDDNTNAASTQAATGKVGISLVWGALVHVAPKKVVTSLALDAQRGMVINDGTLRIPLREVGVCDLAGVCDWKKETTTVYPGTELKIASLMVKPGKKYKARYFNWIKKSVEEIDLSINK
ncbi:fimbrial protein [Serratia fonticola]|uniref:fimbrial protein n=1 Tax=Serratia fonticola TaxID=47917 RepID=UPI001AE9B381|nr:fimbrial protein [Serratia fonticola]MBP1019182.1 fimbrial protein [Serratia fonticola]MBP1036382.1 fimbrial protein [Serratia fonticola]